MNPMLTPGAASWTELMTSDLDASVNFFGPFWAGRLKWLPCLPARTVSAKLMANTLLA